VFVVKCSNTGARSRGLKLDDGLRKSTECLASLSPDSCLTPGSLDRATSQPNLLALSPDDPVSASPRSVRRGKSPNRRRVAKFADSVVKTSNDVVTVAVPSSTAGSGSDPGGKSPRRKHAANGHSSSRPTDRPAEVGKEDGSHEASGNKDTATDKLAVIDHTLAKVMSSLKTLDEMEQSTGTQENVGGVKNVTDEDGQKPTTAVTETVPIVVKTSSAREDRPDEASSLGSFSRGSTQKAATLPKDGSVEKVPADVESQMKHSESSHFDASLEGRRQSPRSSLSRSDSAPHRKGDSGSAANVGQSRFEASSRAIPAATPVVPSNVPSGAPAVPPKPSRKPTVFGSPKTSRPSTDGKAGVVSGKLVKK